MRADARRGERGIKLCLAASGGGHVRQLLDLEPVWNRHDHFFVTEDTALGRSLAEKQRTRFVAHYALGQARLGHPFRMFRGALANAFQSLRIVLAERPDVVITTGAGAVFLVVLFARLMGAKLVTIESFARFDAPSQFGRMIAPFAHRKVVQGAPLKDYWPDAELFDPLRIVEGERPSKQPLLFATVGATLPFPRMIETVLALKQAGGLPERLMVQVGTGGGPKGSAPDGAEIVETLDFERIQQVLGDADLVVTHGGTGSLITALRAGCRVVAMPRRFDLGEHYDDHQQEITSAFATRGLIELAYDSADLGPALDRARAKTPIMATTDPVALIAYLDRALAEWGGKPSV